MKLNKMDKADIKIGGTNYLMVLQLIFLVLQLTGLVNWSWWFVFTPLFINIALMIILFAILVLVLRNNKKI